MFAIVDNPTWLPGPVHRQERCKKSRLSCLSWSRWKRSRGWQEELAKSLQCFSPCKTLLSHLPSKLERNRDACVTISRLLGKIFLLQYYHEAKFPKLTIIVCFRWLSKLCFWAVFAGQIVKHTPLFFSLNASLSQVDTQHDTKWYKMIQNDTKWCKMIQNGCAVVVKTLLLLLH